MKKKVSVRPYEGPPVCPGTIHRPYRPHRTPNTAPKEKKFADKKKKHTRYPAAVLQKKKVFLRDQSSRQPVGPCVPTPNNHPARIQPPTRCMQTKKNQKKKHKIYTKFIQNLYNFFFYTNFIF